jgi:hypothetical protein
MARSTACAASPRSRPKSACRCWVGRVSGTKGTKGVVPVVPVVPAGGTHLKFEVPDEGSCDWKGVPWVDLEERVVPEDAVAVVVDIECRHLLRPCVGNLVRHQNWDFERDAWRSGVRAWRLEGSDTGDGSPRGRGARDGPCVSARRHAARARAPASSAVFQSTLENLSSGSVSKMSRTCGRRRAAGGRP